MSDSVNFTVQGNSNQLPPPLLQGVKMTILLLVLARLTLNCDRALNGSILLINCTPSSPLAAITCSLDGGVQRTCKQIIDIIVYLACCTRMSGRLPLTLNVSLMAPGEHTVYLTATGVNGATAVSGITFLTNGNSSAGKLDGMSAFVLLLFSSCFRGKLS